MRTRAARRIGALAALALTAALAAAPAAAQGTAPAKDSPQETFARAMRERDRGDLYEAIRSFQAILAEHPGLSRARLELAVAYYHAYDHRAALEEARRVLADPATPPGVRANVERLVAQIEAEAAPHRWSGFAALGWMHDSNVSAGPASPNYQFGGSLVAIDPNAVKRSDAGWLATLSGSHRYFAGWRPGVGGREGALLWQSQAQFNSVDYRHESAYDLQVLSLTTGPAWISPPRLRVLAPLQFDRLQLGHASYLDVWGWSPSVIFGAPNGFEITGDAQIQERSYKRAIDAGRDSRYTSYGAQVGRVLAGLALQAGARTTRDNTDDPTLDYRGSEWFGLAARSFGESVSAYVRLTYARFRYDQPDPITTTGRTDRETRLAIGVSYRFGQGEPDPWSVNATLLDTRHESSASLYEFDRTQVSVTLTRAF